MFESLQILKANGTLAGWNQCWLVKVVKGEIGGAKYTFSDFQILKAASRKSHESMLGWSLQGFEFQIRSGKVYGSSMSCSIDFLVAVNPGWYNFTKPAKIATL